MSIETLARPTGSVGASAPAAYVGTIESPVTIQKCEYMAELDMQTLVWAKGLRFPLGRLGSRLMCPRCGSRDMNVIFEPPPTAVRVAAR